MHRFSLLVVSSAVACVVLGLGCSTGSPHDADDTRAPQPAASASAEVPITPADVYERERYWPAIVALTEDWLPPGATTPLQAQYRGTLVRVEADGRVRIDFGRHGKHEVPMDHTDLVQRANEVRTGTRTKLAHNFVLRVGNNLVDSSSEQIRPTSVDGFTGANAYLCIFADPRAEDFPTLARQLAGLEGVHDVRAVFFPQSTAREDLEFVFERLGALSWRVPFMYPHLSSNYTLSLLGEIPNRPRAQLVSPEGRVLYEAGVGAETDLPALRGAIDRVRPTSQALESATRS